MHSFLLFHEIVQVGLCLAAQTTATAATRMYRDRIGCRTMLVLARNGLLRRG